MMYMADSVYFAAPSKAPSASANTKPGGDTSKPAPGSDFQQLLTEKAQDTMQNTTQDTDLLEQAPTTPSQPGTESESDSVAQGLAALLLMQPIALANLQTQPAATLPVQQQALVAAASVAPLPSPALSKTSAPAAPLIPQSVPETATAPASTQAPQTTVTPSAVLPVPLQAQPQPPSQVQPQNQGQVPVQGQTQGQTQSQTQSQVQSQSQIQSAPSGAVGVSQQQTPQSTQAAVSTTPAATLTAAPLSASGEQDKPDLFVQGEGSTKPLFQDTKHLPVKVGDTQTLDTQTSDFDQQLGKQLSDALKQGEQKLSLRLAPKELGTIVVEMTRAQDGSLQVLLRASTVAATTLLTDRSAELSGLLRANTQAPVFVEVQQANNTQQNQQQEQQGNAHHNQQQQQQQQQQGHQQTQDFLDQLRLGLLPLDGEAG